MIDDTFYKGAKYLIEEGWHKVNIEWVFFMGSHLIHEDYDDGKLCQHFEWQRSPGDYGMLEDTEKTDEASERLHKVLR